jgi:hypothetical protein
MTGKLKRFFIKLLIFSLVLVLFTFLLDTILPAKSLPRVLPWLFILFFTVTFLVHWIVLRITELKPTRFVSYFMLATFGKLLIYFLAILTYIFTRKEEMLPFILSFFILYIFYTVFEVVNILSQTKEEHKS